MGHRTYTFEMIGWQFMENNKNLIKKLSTFFETTDDEDFEENFYDIFMDNIWEHADYSSELNFARLGKYLSKEDIGKELCGRAYQQVWNEYNIGESLSKELESFKENTFFQHCIKILGEPKLIKGIGRT